MATRYLCLIHLDTRAPEALARLCRATRLQVARQSRRLTILIDPISDAIPVGHDGGMVIGTMFDRSAQPARMTSFSGTTTKAIESSDGQVLVDRYWGGYVALMPDPDGTVTVIRDPSGAMPCYYAKTTDGYVMASDIETLASAGLIHLTVDWPYLYQYLLAFDFRSSRTALSQVNELLAGHRLNFGPEGATDLPCWSPWDHVHPHTDWDNDEVEANLRETVLGCTRAWATRYDRILLGVSGGLDSSIVAACVATTSAQLTCLTMATDEAEGDERRYAQLLTQALNLPLIERFHQLSDVDVTQSSSTHLPRPLQFAYGQSEHRIRRELTDRFQVQAHFSGVGGDNVFCFMKSASPLLDRTMAERSLSHAFETLEDICDLTGCSRREAISMAIRRAATGTPTYQVKADHSFLATHPGTEVRAFGHPWLKATPHSLPGKGAHISALARIQGTIDGYPRSEPPLILPLLSQPVMEACLAIPTWKWIAGGRDRAVARRAFTDMLPDALIDRRSKGGPNSFVFDVYNSNKAALIDLLVDGLLVARGILDPTALKAVLMSPSPLPSTTYMRLATIAEAEAWARHWEGFRCLNDKEVAALSG